MKKKNKDKLVLDSEKIRSREKAIRILKFGLLITALSFITLYFILRVIYEAGNFTITLDPEFSKTSGLIMYENSVKKESKRILKADKIEFMDNISINWLPENLNTEAEGSHNGENYIAYTNYVENQGSDPINYWYNIKIDDVIKNVDEAIRVMVYRNDEKIVYAKANPKTNEAENGTTKFFSEKDVLVEQRKDFKPGDIDKFTIVVWIEGDDPDCLDDIIGGTIKMHMDITSENI